MVARRARARDARVSGVKDVWAQSSFTNDSDAFPAPTFAKSDRMRSFISHAALLVNVRAKTWRNDRGSAWTKQHAKYRLTNR